MAIYRSYPKIYRMSVEETKGILDGVVSVSEKLDGANFTAFFHEGEVRCGTKSRMLPIGENFRGGQEIIRNNPKVVEFLTANPDIIFYGELLVRHTIKYDPRYYGKVYLFDVYNSATDTNWTQEEVPNLAQELDLETPNHYGTGKFTFDEIKEFASRTDRGVMNEGVVIKSDTYRNQFGDITYAKYVNDKFKEVNNELFGNYSKSDPVYHELRITSNYVTLARVEKIIKKFESLESRKAVISDTPRIIGMTQHDIITEEAWEIFRSAPAIDNKKLAKLLSNRIRTVFHDILDNDVSVAYSSTDA